MKLVDEYNPRDANGKGCLVYTVFLIVVVAVSIYLCV